MNWENVLSTKARHNPFPKNQTSGKKLELILCVCIFLLYVFIGTNRLTHSSLWFDETVEFYISKVLIGDAYSGQPYHSMYERIVSTYQPPLYNILMFFWLKASDSEYWFRLAGVLMGLIGAFGLYFSLKKLTNYKIAAAAVIAYSFTYRLIYYFQECAEYNLMLGLLFCSVYFYLAAFESHGNTQNIYLFTIFCTLSIYSQYGAIFIIVPMAGSLLIQTLIANDYIQFWKVLRSYILAAITAGIPLYVFFLQPQIEYQQTTLPADLAGLSLISFFRSFRTIILWNGFPWLENSSRIIIYLIGLGLILISVVCLVYTKKTVIRHLLILNIAAAAIYYVIVKFNFYAYGQFGNRYNLPFIPLWLVTIFLISFEFLTIISRNMHNFTYRTLQLLGAVFLVCYCASGWNLIGENWQKEDIRGATACWYENHGYEFKTVVYYGAERGFRYYLEYNDKYDKKYIDSVIFQPWMRNQDLLEYKAFLLRSFGGQLPDQFYLIASHFGNDLDTMIAAIESEQYTKTTLFDTSGKLYLFISH